MALLFSTKTDQSNFIGWIRALADDLNEFSSAAAILIAINARENDSQLKAALNKNANFWNSILLSLQTTAIIVIGRIHDDGRGAYFKNIVKGLSKYKTMATHLNRFKAIELNHQFLLEKCKKLRDNVFAHTSHIRPLVVTFGFDGMTWDLFSSYWNEIAKATEILERDMFDGKKYGPMFFSNQLQDDMKEADKLLDSIRVLEQAPQQSQNTLY